VRYGLIPYIKQITFYLLKVNLTKQQNVVCIILRACDTGIESCQKEVTFCSSSNRKCLFSKMIKLNKKMVFLMLSFTFIISVSCIL
jgi:hypothetical protein